MSRRKSREIPLSQREIPELLRSKARSPVCVVLGSPAEVANLLGGLGLEGAVCYQMDLHQAARTRETLAEAGVAAEVVTLPDLWDLPAEFQTVIYLPARTGERELKIDMVDQGYHVLRPGGTMVIWSPYETELFFPNLVKKVFGRAHVHRSEPAERARKRQGGDTILWASRTGERPRRRHEMAYQARIAGGPSCRFVSRPGVFSYGRLDEGARALAEVMDVREGNRVLDVGCGTGTNGVFAWQKAQPTGHIVFVDSNVRALALAELNARANGVEHFETVASSTVEGPAARSFDVALANPPYHATTQIASLFVERSAALLRPDGRFYLVTRQPSDVVEMVQDAFGRVEAVLHRGYTILCA